jgi:hypothetical protein
MFIRKKKVKSGKSYKIYYYIEECKKIEKKRYKMITLRYLGTAQTLLKKLKELDKLKKNS